MVDTVIRVAVQSNRAQPLTQLHLQIVRQAVRIFHRVELDEAFRRLHGVGMHGLHVLADTTVDDLAQCEFGGIHGLDTAR